MKQIVIDVPDEKIAHLEALMADCGITSKKEFVSNALTLLAWSIRERKAGRIIASVNEATATYKEVLLPALENVSVPALPPTEN